MLSLISITYSNINAISTANVITEICIIRFSVKKREIQ